MRMFSKLALVAVPMAMAAALIAATLPQMRRYLRIKKM